MKTTAFGITDRGRVRALNEDALLIDEKLGLYAVADGMGGHNCGEVASGMAVGIILDAVSRMSQQSALYGTVDHHLSREANLLSSAIRLANRAIFEASSSQISWSGMGTTLAAVLIGNGRATIAHVGDSRVYLLRNSLLKQLTSDHSLVAEQIRKGMIEADQARVSRHRNIITRALGHEIEVQVDLTELELEPGDRLLICSDGLNGMLTEEEITALILARNTPEAACRELIEQANAAGGRDNVTALIVSVLNNSFFASVKGMVKG
jgi:protein phosphatase